MIQAAWRFRRSRHCAPAMCKTVPTFPAEKVRKGLSSTQNSKNSSSSVGNSQLSMSTKLLRCSPWHRSGSKIGQCHQSKLWKSHYNAFLIIFGILNKSYHENCEDNRWDSIWIPLDPLFDTQMAHFWIFVQLPWHV